MKPLCTAYLAVLLLTLHLSSQVIRAQTTAATESMSTKGTESAMDNSNSNSNTTAAAADTTAAPAAAAEATVPPNSGSGIIAAFTLLLPLAVASVLLHGCS